MDRANIASCAAVVSFSEGSFKGHSTELQYVERDRNLQGTPEFNDNWLYEGTGSDGYASFKLSIKCSALLIAYMDSASIEVGTAQVFVDGEEKLNIDPHIIGWGHANAYIAHRGGPAKVREIEVRIPEKDRDKRFTLLGFGVVD